MGEWLEIPSHRVLKLSRQEFVSGFKAVNENGFPIDVLSMSFLKNEIYRIYRIADNAMFVVPKFLPMFEDCNSMITVEPYYG